MTRVAGSFSCAVLLTFAAMVSNGCGNGGDPGEGANAVAQQLAADATERVCGILAACCGEADLPYDDQACKAFHEPRLLQHFSLQIFLGAELDTGRAQRCLDSIGQVSDGCAVDRSVGDYPDTCDWLFKGSVPLGGKCDSSHGCITSRDNPVFCDVPSDSKSGLCVASSSLARVHRRAGQSCSNTCVSDKGGCDGAGSGGNCYTSDGLFCSRESKQCEPQRDSGEPCFPVGFYCATGTQCNPDDLKCEPIAVEPCNDSSDCATGTYCKDAKCGPTRPLGAPCSERSDCGENSCTAGTCQRPSRATAESCGGQFLPPSSPGPSTG